MKKTGVIQIIDTLNTGGAEVLAVNIANALFDCNLNSHLCTSRQEGLLKNNLKKEVGYLFLNKKKTLDFKSIFKLRSYLVKNNISIIHAHSSSYFIAFCVKCMYPKVKIVWHDHFGASQKLDTRKLFPLKYISSFFKAIISVNSDLKEWSVSNLLCKNVFFLNNFPVFNTTTSKTILKGLEGKRIVHLAAFREQKDHVTLVEAFDLFVNKNQEWTLHLVGGLNDKTYSKKIQDLIKQKGLQNHIFVYGSCLDISNILCQSSIGVLSSKSEGLPVALLEYGFARLPVIVTNVGECSKVIKHNKSGLVVEPENTIQLLQAFKTLASSSKKRDAFSAQHHKIVLKSYSKESFVNQLLKIYNLI